MVLPCSFSTIRRFPVACRSTCFRVKYPPATTTLSRIDLGSAPPVISNVRIFEDEHELTPDVMLDMELTWHTEAMLAEVLLQLVSTHLKFLPKSVAKALSGLMTFRVRSPTVCHSWRGYFHACGGQLSCVSSSTVASAGGF